MAAKDIAVPIVISERNNPRLQHFNLMWRTARSLTYPNAYAFVTMTQGAADYYPASQRRRTEIIPNPVALPQDWKNRRGNKTIAAVGRLTAQKRFDRLIDAFAKVAKDCADWKLVIWGEGELRDALENQCASLQPDIAQRISLPGVTPTPGGWIETADVFVLSSEFEGWPNVIAEAMTAGLPILALGCEYGVSELLEDGKNGLLVPANDMTAFETGMRTLLNDAAIREQYAQNAKEAAKQYTIENVAKRWDDLLNDAIINTKTQ